MKRSFLIKSAFRLAYKRYSTSSDVLTSEGKRIFQDLFPDNASSEISVLLQSGRQCVYAGFDPTADSLHVGNLLVLASLLRWQRAGHQTIAVIGGATAQIGDPSGRSTDRPELAERLADSNAEGIKSNITTIFKNHEEFIWKQQAKETRPLHPPLVVNNLSWYQNLDVVRFIAETGRKFRVGAMLSRHSVQTRMASDAGISFAEFSYQIFQAYDWLHLLRKYNCRFQVGGSDQMGNIKAGHDLVGRTEDKKVYGLTLPLVTTESGNKFGKTAGNAVWLNSEKTSPFELYQFFVRMPDSTVGNLLNLFTFLPQDNLDTLLAEHQASPDLRKAQKVLAEQVTLLVHGAPGLRSAELATSALYQSNLEALTQLSAQELLQLFKGASCCELRSRPATVLQLALEAKCFLTERDATRIITAGGFAINHQKLTNPSEPVDLTKHVLPNGISLLRVGKKNYTVVHWLG